MTQVQLNRLSMDDSLENGRQPLPVCEEENNSLVNHHSRVVTNACDKWKHEARFYLSEAINCRNQIIQSLEKRHIARGNLSKGNFNFQMRCEFASTRSREWWIKKRMQPREHYQKLKKNFSLKTQWRYYSVQPISIQKFENSIHHRNPFWNCSLRKFVAKKLMKNFTEHLKLTWKLESGLFKPSFNQDFRETCRYFGHHKPVCHDAWPDVLEQYRKRLY